MTKKEIEKVIYKNYPFTESKSTDKLFILIDYLKTVSKRIKDLEIDWMDLTGDIILPRMKITFK